LWEYTLPLIGRVFVAGLFGGLIGLERDIHGRAAGLRTHLLVSMGAALFTVLSEAVAASRLAADGAQVFADPGRIAAQIVTGIGFLGAGAILKDGLTVRGLTTAACLWVVAAIGMAAGAGQYVVAGATTLMALFALAALKHVERLYPKDIYRTLTIVAAGDVDLTEVVDLVTQKSVHVLVVNFERDYENGTMTVRLPLRLYERELRKTHIREIVQSLEASGIPLKSITWEH
jgi:putative Mg2+ transporter-C (MgtC) family protein